MSDDRKWKSLEERSLGQNKKKTWWLSVQTQHVAYTYRSFIDADKNSLRKHGQQKLTATTVTYYKLILLSDQTFL